MKLAELDGNIDDDKWRKHTHHQILMSNPPCIVKKWHITVSTLGSVTCLKATFCCLFYILKVFSIVIFPMISEIKRCHNVMTRGLTLHISWSTSLCSRTLLSYLVKKNTPLFKKITVTISIYISPLFLYLVKKYNLFRKVQRRLTWTVTKWLFHWCNASEVLVI